MKKDTLTTWSNISEVTTLTSGIGVIIDTDMTTAGPKVTLDTDLQDLAAIDTNGIIVKSGTGKTYSSVAFPSINNQVPAYDTTSANLKWVTPKDGTVTNVTIESTTTDALVVTNPTVTSNGIISLKVTDELNKLSALSGKGVVIRSNAGAYSVNSPTTNGDIPSFSATGALTWITPKNGTVSDITLGTGFVAVGTHITSTGTITLADTAVSSGTYTNPTITVDKQGRITDAQNGAAPTGGTVTSVGLSAISSSAYFNTSATPVITAGTLNIEFVNAELKALANPVLGTGKGLVVRTGANTYAISQSDVDGKVLTGKADGTISWAAAGGTGTVTNITTGTGLTGGSISTTGTIALADTAVTAGDYTHTSISVDAQGRITKATSGTVTQGTVTQVGIDSTTPGALIVTGGPISTSGVISLKVNDELKNLSTLNTDGLITRIAGAYSGNTPTIDGQTPIFSKAGAVTSWVTPGGTGTVSKVDITTTNSSAYLTASGGPITSTGSIDIEFVNAELKALSTGMTGKKGAVVRTGDTAYATVVPTADNQVLTGSLDGTVIWNTPASGGTVTKVSTGTGLTGGDITNVGTISLANTAVTPSTYSNPTITVDQQGRITTAKDGTTTVASTTPPSTTLGTIAIFDNSNVKIKDSGLKLPPAAPTVNGQIISGDTSGAMSWINLPTSSGTVTSVTAGSGLVSSPVGGIVTSGSLALTTTGVAANTYISPDITIDAQGRITSATNKPLTVTSTASSSTMLTNIPIFDSSNTKLKDSGLKLPTSAAPATGYVLSGDTTGAMSWVPSLTSTAATTSSSVAIFDASVNKIKNSPFTLPAAVPAVNGSVLSGNVSGAMFWSSGMPIGSIVMWPLETLPTGPDGTASTSDWLFCDGMGYTKTDVAYAALYSVIGIVWGQPNKSITSTQDIDVDKFCVPDFRGMFPRGWNKGKTNGYYDQNATSRSIYNTRQTTIAGVATPGVVSTVTGDKVGTVQLDSLQSHTHNMTINSTASGSTKIAGGGSGTDYNPTIPIQSGTIGTTGNSSSETRPVNFSIAYIIKYK